MSNTVNWDDVDEADDFSPVPDDDYLVVAKEVNLKETRNGDDQWRIRWAIVAGRSSGLKYAKRLVFDSITFSDKGLKRCKLVLSRAGVKLGGEMAMTTDMLVGKRAVIQTTEDEYEAENDKGEMVKRQTNKVPFAGVHRMDDEEHSGWIEKIGDLEEAVAAATAGDGDSGGPDDDVPF